MALTYNSSFELTTELSSEASSETTLPLYEAAPRAQARRRQRLLVVLGLVGLDALVLLLNFALVYLLRFKLFGFFYVPKGSVLRFYSELVFWTIPPWLLILSAFRLYDLRSLRGGSVEFRRIAFACTFAIIMLLATSFFMDETLVISRAWLLMVWFGSIVMLLVSRSIGRQAFGYLHNLGLIATRVLIVGANSEAQQMSEYLKQSRNAPGLEVVGFVGDRRSRSRVTADETIDASQLEHLRANRKQDNARWLGLYEQIRAIVDSQQVDEVVIASTALNSKELFEVVRLLTTSNVEIRLSSSLYQVLTTSLEVQEINGLPLVTVSKVRITGLNAFWKRALDIVVSVGVLLILSPLLLLLAVLIRRDSSGPVIYRRRVVGQGGKVFDAYKLRTMLVNGAEILAARPDLEAELSQHGKLKDDPRLTPLGRFLRRSSLDELPQLFNVLRGQMSLVGPRMLTYQEMIKFGRWQSNLLTVKPGLTGLWQISGRSNLPYADRVRLDMHYIRNYSIWSDLSILFQTVPAVLRRRGAY